MEMQHVEQICKIGQGAECCRYLTMGPQGFCCEKRSPEMKLYLDRRAAEGRMNARGDNCEGK